MDQEGAFLILNPDVTRNGRKHLELQRHGILPAEVFAATDGAMLVETSSDRAFPYYRFLRCCSTQLVSDEIVTQRQKIQIEEYCTKTDMFTK